MKEFKWMPCSHRTLVRLVKDYQNMLCLRDWEIRLETGVVPSRAMRISALEKDDAPAYRYDGQTYALPDQQEAIIWIPLFALEEDNHSAQEVLLHEMLHVFHAAYPDNEELRVRILSNVVHGLKG